MLNTITKDGPSSQNQSILCYLTSWSCEIWHGKSISLILQDCTTKSPTKDVFGVNYPILIFREFPICIVTSQCKQTPMTSL